MGGKQKNDMLGSIGKQSRESSRRRRKRRKIRKKEAMEGRNCEKKVLSLE